MLENYRSRVDSEQALLLVFLVISGYMFIKSYSYQPVAAEFPRIMSGMAIIFGVILLFRNYFPDVVRAFLLQEEGLALGSMGDEEIQEDLEEAGDEMQTRAEVMDRPIHPSVFTGLMTIFLLVGSYLFGLFWVGPVFVVGYLRWFDQPLWKTAVVLAVTIVMLYGFIEFLNVPFMEGALWDGVVI